MYGGVWSNKSEKEKRNNKRGSTSKSAFVLQVYVPRYRTVFPLTFFSRYGEGPSRGATNIIAARESRYERRTHRISSGTLKRRSCGRFFFFPFELDVGGSSGCDVRGVPGVAGSFLPSSSMDHHHLLYFLCLSRCVHHGIVCCRNTGVQLTQNGKGICVCSYHMFL